MGVAMHRKGPMKTTEAAASDVASSSEAERDAAGPPPDRARSSEPQASGREVASASVEASVDDTTNLTLNEILMTALALEIRHATGDVHGQEVWLGPARSDAKTVLTALSRSSLDKVREIERIASDLEFAEPDAARFLRNRAAHISRSSTPDR